MTSYGLNSRLFWLQHQIDKTKSRLQHAPEGSICACREREAMRLYQKFPGDRAKTYLNSGNIQTAKALAQKHYDQKALQLLEEEAEAIKSFQELGTAARLRDTYHCLPPVLQALIDPIDVSDEEYLLRWKSQSYEQPEVPSLSFRTQNGEYVRSKSEVIIANALYAAGVPYLYEKPLRLPTGKTIWPDFTVLNARTRQEYFWEHLGMLDDASYQTRTLDKLEAYILSGFLPGLGLLITFEMSTHPLNTEVIDCLIRKHLL